MKKPALAALFSLLAALALAAQETTPAAGGDKQRAARERIRQYDKDGDGRLSDEEKAAAKNHMREQGVQPERRKQLLQGRREDKDAFWQLVRAQGGQLQTAYGLLEARKAEEAAAVIDAHLASREWMAGGAFSLADIVNGCAAHRWLNLPCDKVARPNLSRWYATFKARPASRQVTSLALS